jgi:hypothetical protein
MCRVTPKCALIVASQLVVLKVLSTVLSSSIFSRHSTAAQLSPPRNCSACFYIENDAFNMVRTFIISPNHHFPLLPQDGKPFQTFIIQPLAQPSSAGRQAVPDHRRLVPLLPLPRRAVEGPPPAAEGDGTQHHPDVSSCLLYALHMWQL